MQYTKLTLLIMNEDYTTCTAVFLLSMLEWTNVCAYVSTYTYVQKEYILVVNYKSDLKTPMWYSSELMTCKPFLV